MAFRRSRVEAEMDEEIRSHLDMAAEDYRRNGADPECAHYLARRSFGAVEPVKERYRDLSRFQSIEAFLQDIGYSLRTLRRRPIFTLVAVAMLALGIGINAAVFTVVNAALFKGWPLVERNDRIVEVTTNKYVSYADFEDWRSQARSFEGMAMPRGRFHTLDNGGAAPQTWFTTAVTANTFQLLGVKPFLGRDFLPSDEQPGAPSVIILNYAVWVSQFGANPAIVGKTAKLDGLPATVIGVMPKGFSFAYPMTQDLWMPLVPPAGARARATTFGGPFAFARLRDGVTLEQARAEMETIGRRLAKAYPRTNQGVVPVVNSFEEWFIGSDARTLYKGMWVAVGFVLLIVCANVANLLVEQAVSRAHEISIRLALGAGRWCIVRQFVAESLLLSIAGGLIGWGIAVACVRIYELAQVHPDVLSYTIDGRVLLYLIAVSVGTGLIGGLATAAHLTRSKPAKRLSRVFVAAEMVLAVVLLASAGVIGRSFLNVYTADVGVKTANILATATPDLPPERYPDAKTWSPFYRDLLARLQALPGVRSAALGAIPGLTISPVAYELEGAPDVEGKLRPTVAGSAAGPAYFRTLGAGIIAGREFDDSDRASSLPVAIVNRRFAEQNWPGEVPLGKRLRLLPGTAWLTIVGVVSNITANDPALQTFPPVVYVPYQQKPGPFMPVLIQTSVAPGSLVNAVKRQIYAMDPDLPIPRIMPLPEWLGLSYGFQRNVTALFVVFAIIALVLASVGLYATVSYSVSRRVREIGIRMAIGATDGDILALVFRQGILPVSAGLTIGLAVSFAVNRVLKSQLVGVSPADPIALLAASAVLILCAALGCWIPARRAARVDPAVAVKHG